jgi:hypothetical protein
MLKKADMEVAEEVTEEVVVVEEEEAMVEIAMRSQNTFPVLLAHLANLVPLVTREILELRGILVPLELRGILVKMEVPVRKAKEALQENQAMMEFLENREFLEKEVHT